MAVSHSAPLLVVEDSAADFRMLKRLMRKMEVQSPIYRCQTGDEALDLMYRTGRYESTEALSRPGMIMLDLNLPGTDGRSVLAKLKQDKTFSQIPIVIFTCSSTPSDIEYCYQHGANGYLVKPVGIQELTQKVQAFVDYWLAANTAPFFVLS